MLELDEEEADILEQFKAFYASLEYDDNTFCRFLTARCFNLKESMAMFDGWYMWRKESRIDSIKMTDYPQILSLRAFDYLGKDKTGRPIAFCKVKKIVPSSFDTEQFKMFFVAFLENVITK